MILLCAATATEIQPTLDWLSRVRLRTGVEVCITGVGIGAATHAITKAVLQCSPSVLLQAGIAGSFDLARLPFGATVAIAADRFGDLGVWEGDRFLDLADLGFGKEGQLANPHAALLQSLGLGLATAVTVQQITTAPEMMEVYRVKGALVESMEGAALHLVALEEDIPFLQLRSISNAVGERNKKEWRLGAAISELNAAVQKTLTKIAEP